MSPLAGGSRLLACGKYANPKQENYMDRRNFMAAFAAPTAASLALALVLPSSGVRARPVAARRVRHRVRHRIRRRISTRFIHGRTYWVVPLHLAVGWELMHLHRVVEVREIRVVERDGRRSEIAIVQDATGQRMEVDITREETRDNSIDYPGMAIPESDMNTPALEDSVRP
jgi:hypothetical protein